MSSENVENAKKQEEPKNEIEILQEQLKEAQDKYVRLLAESENARKRMQKERHDLTQFAVENVIVEFLNPLDSFEKALKFAESSSEEVKRWAVGFEMILGQFKQVLSAHGISEFDSLGEHFDPHMHEALEVVETDNHPPGTIIHEFAKGYKLGERVIRVARVKVAKSLDLSQEEKLENNKENSHG
jgi:molecular chaperone GrpE